MEEAMQKLEDESNIDDIFLYEWVLALSKDLIPYFANFSNHVILFWKIYHSSSVSSSCMS